MSKEWYNKIAIKNGGYKSDASYKIVGESGEDYFESLLQDKIHNKTVLDMGCGHGAFTIQMAKHCKSIVGADNSVELLKIAEKLKDKMILSNVNFVYASTKEEMTLKEETFDLVYVRRGPTSIVENAYMLKDGGQLMGIYTDDLDILDFKKRLGLAGFVDIDIKEFNDAYYIYEDEVNFAKHISSMHCSPDYTHIENKKALEDLIEKHTVDGQLRWPQKRYVFEARRLIKNKMY